MGFGPGWRPALPAEARAQDVSEKLESLRRYSLDLPFQNVLPVVERLRGSELEAERRRGLTRRVQGDLSRKAGNFRDSSSVYETAEDAESAERSR